jgi:hypothetical protein
MMPVQLNAPATHPATRAGVIPRVRREQSCRSRGPDLFACMRLILDQGGQVVLRKDLPTDPDAFLQAIALFRDDLVVCCEFLFCWYWLANLCYDENIAFVLGHALHMRAIQGAKTKDDPSVSKHHNEQPHALCASPRDSPPYRLK